uniref:TIL domain-containing protein n=1 Tax=Heliothis virescens TaxID=7102 RepID=A0A2A4JY02_HELVI
MYYQVCLVIFAVWIQCGICRDEDKIMKACYWPNEAYEPCFGGCAEVSCDNPRNHLRPCYPYCEPGCVCEEPYVRDDRTHQCVLPQDCSPTQMGIPVPAKRAQEPKSSPKYQNRMPRTHTKRSDSDAMDFGDDVQNTLGSPSSPISVSTNVNSKDDSFKRNNEVSRMGNYFNIVIAPPPIKALQPRKLLQNDAFRNGAKRIS